MPPPAGWKQPSSESPRPKQRWPALKAESAEAVERRDLATAALDAASSDLEQAEADLAAAEEALAAEPE